MIREAKEMIEQDAIRAMVKALGYIPIIPSFINNEVCNVKTWCPICFRKLEFKDVAREEVDHIKHYDTGFERCYACNTVLRLTYDNSLGFRSTFFQVYEHSQVDQPERVDKK